MSNGCNDLWDVSLHDLRAVYDPEASLKLVMEFQILARTVVLINWPKNTSPSFCRSFVSVSIIPGSKGALKAKKHSHDHLAPCKTSLLTTGTVFSHLLAEKAKCFVRSRASSWVLDACVHWHTFVRAHKYSYVCVYMCTQYRVKNDNMYISSVVHIHTFIRTCMYTYMYMHMYMYTCNNLV